MAKSSSVEITAKLVQVMEQLFASEQEIGIRELARVCDLPKSTVARLLGSLEEVHWVTQDEQSKKYRIGMRLLQLTSRWHLNMELVRLSTALMEDLVSKTNLTAIMTVLDGNNGRCIHKAESKQAVKLVSTIGAIIPLHAGASGKSLLAFLPEADLDRILRGSLPAFTSHTITDPVELKANMRKICAEGYVISSEEVDDGAAAIGFPIFDRKNVIIASLSIAGSKFDVLERAAELVPLVGQTATAITNAINKTNQ